MQNSLTPADLKFYISPCTCMYRTSDTPGVYFIVTPYRAIVVLTSAILQVLHYPEVSGVCLHILSAVSSMPVAVVIKISLWVDKLS